LGSIAGSAAVKPVAFEYWRPETLAEALAAIAELGAEAVPLAGGMSLGPMLNMRLVRPRAVIDLNPLAELAAIETRGDEIVTGALCRQADALADPALRREVPLLAQALPYVGHYQTRHRGTLGGSVAHADPSAEIPLCLVTLGGAVLLRSRRTARRVAADRFFAGALTTARRSDELVTALAWPRARAPLRYAFAEIAQRHGDFAIAACACAVSLDQAGRIKSLRLGFGGVLDRPLVADTAGFVGSPASAETAEHVAVEVTGSLTPIADRSATAAYRRALARLLARRVLERCFAAPC
jgi:2-furoyl-CoA dehydrogenase FAD binding subunit